PENMEITSLLNGTQVGQGLIKQFKKSPKEIEDYYKQVVCGSRNYFWSKVAINDYLKDCKYILKFRGVIELEDKHHMIYEWSNHGNLQHTFEYVLIFHAYNVMLGVNCIVQLPNFETGQVPTFVLKYWWFSGYVEERITYVLRCGRFSSDESSGLNDEKLVVNID
ncbi:5663_t:CDS:2, partial [Gigaspora rosea]